jgi:hypothetical protein
MKNDCLIMIRWESKSSIESLQPLEDLLPPTDRKLSVAERGVGTPTWI